MADEGKIQDQLLEKIGELIRERDLARIELAEERVAHRRTRKELQEVAGMVLR